MKLTRFILLLAGIIVLSAKPLTAQENSQVDSLITLLENASGEERIEILLALAADRSLSIDERLEYSEESLKLAKEIENPQLLVKSHMQVGEINFAIDENQEAIRSYEKAYELCLESNNEEGKALSLHAMGRVYLYSGEHEKATEYFEQTRNIAIKSKNKQLEAKALYSIAELKKRNADYQAALEYYYMARPLSEEASDLVLLADILGDIGLVMYLQGDFQGSTKNYVEAASLYNQTGSKYDEAKIYLRLGNAYLRRADYDVALQYFQQALPIFEEIHSATGIDAVTNSMGVVYFSQELYDKALDVHFKALELSKKLGAQKEIARSLDNVGTIYSHLATDSLKRLLGSNFREMIKVEHSDKYLKLYDEALQYYNEALEIREELKDVYGMVYTLTNIGIIYVNSGKPAMAFEPLERALELNENLNNKSAKANILLWLGAGYLAIEDYSMALDYLNAALELALETDTKENTKYIYKYISLVYEKQNDYVKALHFHKLYYSISDTLTQEDRRKAIADMQVKYETDATEKENALLMAESELADAKLRQTRVILIITIIAIGLFIVMMLQLIRQNNLKRKANKELALKNDLITEQKKEITDSIQYASRIQNAMLPPGDYVDSLMPDRFIIYMPRDIVSGDYYYITEKEGRVICVVADCTGHGVPGAFMSMLGIAYLNEIISKHSELHSDEILGELRNHVITSLHQTGKEGESQDGMDLALFILDRETRKLEFSGANNSLLLFRDGELIEYKADKMPIGIHNRYKESFTRHRIDLQKEDMVYTFSDGYPDQFGGPRQKKFMIKNFKRMLMEIHQKPVDEQKNIMEKTLKDWMADNDQVDDILVIGVRI